MHAPVQSEPDDRDRHVWMIATIPARTSLGSFGHASSTVQRSGESSATVRAASSGVMLPRCSSDAPAMLAECPGSGARSAGFVLSVETSAAAISSPCPTCDAVGPLDCAGCPLDDIGSPEAVGGSIPPAVQSSPRLRLAPPFRRGQPQPAKTAHRSLGEGGQSTWAAQGDCLRRLSPPTGSAVQSSPRLRLAPPFRRGQP